MALNIKRNRKQVPFYEDRAAGMQVSAAEKVLDEAKVAAAEAEKAKSGPDARLTSKTGPAAERAVKAVTAAEKALAEAKAAAAATVLDLTLEALPKKVWAEAEEACPARPGDTTDKFYNLNVDTFLAEVLGKSVVEVRQRGTGELRTDVTAQDWTEATVEMDDGSYSALFLAIIDLNRNAANPF